jgi:hypothetical protein
MGDFAKAEICMDKSDGKDLKNFFHKDMVAITPTDRGA